VEGRVERRIKSFKSPTESLTPGALYVLTSTLFGSILSRSSPLLRFSLPPTLFVASAFHFLPETARKVSDYVYSIEKAHAPQLTDFQTNLFKNARNGWTYASGHLVSGRQILDQGVERGVGWVSDLTGLKMREAYGLALEKSEAVKERAEQVVERVGQETGALQKDDESKAARLKTELRKTHDI